MCPDRHELDNITSRKNKKEATTKKKTEKRNPKCNDVQKRKRIYQIKSSNVN